MKTDHKIIDEKIQCNITRGVISPLYSGRIDKYDYVTGEEILPSDQSRIIEQANFTCSLFAKAFEKEIKQLKNKEKN